MKDQRVKKLDVWKKFPRSRVTRVVKQVKCWWVVFDTDGYAPADADVVACSSKELAKEIAGLLKGGGFYVVLGGKCYCETPCFSVEGYNWACRFDVREGWAEVGEVVGSFVDLVEKDFFETVVDAEKGQVDGVYEDGSDEEDG